MSDKPLIKFGVPASEDPHVFEPLPFCYPNLWAVEQTTGPQRLVIAPADEHCELLLQLARELREPFGLLYVLLLSRTGAAAPGRYESPVIDRPKMEQFVREFAPYLEGDGRHHFWITSLPDNANLVYDQHNVIFAYGPLDRFQKLLESRGFTYGTVTFPAPHMHCYNQPMDAEEERILKWWDWKHFPLQPDDDY